METNKREQGDGTDDGFKNFNYTHVTHRRRAGRQVPTPSSDKKVRRRKTPWQGQGQPLQPYLHLEDGRGRVLPLLLGGLDPLHHGLEGRQVVPRPRGVVQARAAQAPPHHCARREREGRPGQVPPAPEAQVGRRDHAGKAGVRRGDWRRLCRPDQWDWKLLLVAEKLRICGNWGYLVILH